MFPFLPKKLFFLLPSRSSFSSSSSSQVRRLHNRFPPVGEFSSSSSSPVEEENIKVWVWWNFNDCRVPPGVSILKVAASIIGAVRANGIQGPIDIVAYGDVTQFSKLERIALPPVGVYLRHINGGMDIANKHLINDLLNWTIFHSPPAHIFLISSNEMLLHHLRMENYNILVAYPGRAPYVICSAATIIWPWSSILKGENLIGKYFNYPPDGPLNSWYGDLKVPTENPTQLLESPHPLNSWFGDSKVPVEDPTKRLESPHLHKMRGSFSDVIDWLSSKVKKYIN